MAGSGLQIPEIDSGELAGGFSPLKHASTNPTMKLTKIRRSKLFPASFWSKYFRSNEIYAGFGVISPNLVRSQPNLMEISLDLARSPPDLVRFRLKYTVLAGFLYCGRFWPNQPLFDMKSDRSNLTPSPVNDGYELPPPDSIGSVMGWAQTRPTTNMWTPLVAVPIIFFRVVNEY